MNNAAKSIIAGVVLVGLGIVAVVGLEKVDNGNV